MGTAALLVMVPQPSALGGGWWSSIALDRHELLSGESRELSSQVLFDSRYQIDDMEQARSGAVTYYAYLLIEWDEAVLDRAVRHDFRPDWWRTPTSKLQLGRVAFGDWDSNLAWARTTFEVPDIESGRYSIMFCDLGCESPLADVIPTPVRIFDEQGFARNLDRQINGVVRRTEADRDRIRRLERSLAAAPDKNRVDGLYTDLFKRMSKLNDRVDDLAIRPDKAGVSWPWVLFAALAAAVLSSLMTRRRVRSPEPPPPPTEPTEEPIKRELAGVS
ncbi:MAG: hypothetical protein ACRDJB_00260 [Actinomycetota bacterium]